MSHFIDRAVVHAAGGHGGDGCVSVRREKFKPLGGPDGGNGGNGGKVIARVDGQATTLLEYHYHPHQRAGNGGIGKGSLNHGKNAADLILPVPEGTVIKDSKGVLLADLVEPGQEYLIAAGGQGGAGNAALASQRRKAPGFALLGLHGESAEVVFELKTIADIALIGFPSAGKSSLISTISAARPKIAEYPFTTLTPNLGVVQAGNTRFTVADVPGLIPGASEGKGLGLEFLRHIERCAVLVHVIDCATLEPGRDPLGDLETIEAELAHYAQNVESDAQGPSSVSGKEGMPSVPLLDRPRLIVLNKIDIPDGQELAAFVRDDLNAKGWPVFEVSTITHEGLKELCFAMAQYVEEARQQLLKAGQDRRPFIHPPSLPAKAEKRKNNHRDFILTVETRQGDSQEGEEKYYRIVGAKPERWVQQTDFNNDEAVGYLADRFARLGIEDELFKVGAKPGATVIIGAGDGVIFDWEPTLTAGAELLGSPRGTDSRFDDISRPTRTEKRQERDGDAVSGQGPSGEIYKSGNGHKKAREDSAHETA